jgi:polyisoprenoid-binding protein YceI
MLVLNMLGNPIMM